MDDELFSGVFKKSSELFEERMGKPKPITPEHEDFAKLIVLSTALALGMREIMKKPATTLLGMLLSHLLLAYEIGHEHGKGDADVKVPDAFIDAFRGGGGEQAEGNG